MADVHMSDSPGARALSPRSRLASAPRRVHAHASRSAASAAWETSKENAQPLRRGRKAEALSTALSEGPTAAEVNEAKRLEFEAALENPDDAGSDPLAVWCEYIRWLQDTFVTGAGGPQLLPVLERCAQAFKDDARYADDARYLRVWIIYADMVLDAEPIFDYLYDHRIGQELALFYESWAAVLEAKRKLDAADKAFRRGLLIKAQPLGRLERAFQQFQHRLVKRIMTQPEPAAPAAASARASKERKALNRLKKGETAAGASRPTKERAAGAMRSAPAAPPTATMAAAGNFNIFVDAAGGGGDDDEGRAAWETGTATENKKENAGRVEPWAGITMPQKRARAAASADAPFAIHTDDSMAAEEAEE
eukprot:1298688-Prymnesium_polylepis.1